MKLLKWLALSCLVLASGCAGSSGDAARERALLPSLQLAWPAVEDDIQRGVLDGVEDGDLSKSKSEALLASANRLEASLSEDLNQARSVTAFEWPIVHPWASRGVIDRLDDGQIGPGVAESFDERIKNFDEGVRKLQAQGR